MRRINTIIMLTVVAAALAIAPTISASEPPKMVDLGTLGGISSTANGITKHGQVVGSSTTASHQDHAVLWTK